MSQDELGRRIGVTFQQLQKYEHGINRISAGRLYEISVVLDLPIAHFFEGAPKLTKRR
jgi:transcriptional regulator with XRE-family HTH domain